MDVDGNFDDFSFSNDDWKKTKNSKHTEQPPTENTITASNGNTLLSLKSTKQINK